MSSKPNLLIICSDEHARSVLGCYGNPVVQTPTLDKLAARGQRFTQAYTPSPICVSARACLATGLSVFENRCWSSAQPYYGQFESWMHRLRANGHTVVSIGKLHFRSSDDDNGFSEEIMPMHLANAGRGWLNALLRNPLPAFPQAQELAAECGPGETDYTDYDRRVTQATCDWLQNYPSKIHDKPWALFVSFVSPHYPLIAPQRFFDLYPKVPQPHTSSAHHSQQHPVLKQMLQFWNYDDYFSPEQRDLARRSYYGLCSFLDDNIRQVLSALEQSIGLDNTVIIYLSDHGEMLGNHGFWTKSVMYEDSVAIPMLMSGAGISKGVNHTPVSLIDIAPTVEQAVGIAPQNTTKPWQAHALQQFIANPEPERPVLSEYHDGGSPTGIFMLRYRDWKYIYYADDYPAQLFHLQNDPHEINDLGQRPEFAQQRTELHKALQQILDPDAVNQQAFDDQAELVDQYGGIDAIKALPSFNHTPIEHGKNG